jgi:hypothetical protein
MLAHLLTTQLIKRVAPLALLSLALACDSTPTAPPPPPPPPPDPPGLLTSLLPLPPQVFDGSQYFGISVSLAAQQQYGPSATAVQVSGHLYGWRAQVGSAQYSIDMRRAVRDQFGAGYILGAVGVGIYDWRAVHWSTLSNYVLPVMVIGSDYFYNVSAVQSALANLKSVLVTTRSWYDFAMRADAGSNKLYRMLQPLVVFQQSSYTSAQWNGFSAQGGQALWDFAWNAYAAAYPTSPLGSYDGALRVLLAPFTGNSPTVFGGADYALTLPGGYPVPAFAAVPPAVSSLTCSWGTNGDGLLYNIPCERATFWVGHELGHMFRLLDVSNSNCSGDCWGSIMAAIDGDPYGALGPLPPATVLTQDQKNTLLDSPFFF